MHDVCRCISAMVWVELVYRSVCIDSKVGLGIVEIISRCWGFLVVACCVAMAGIREFCVRVC